MHVARDERGAGGGQATCESPVVAAGVVEAVGGGRKGEGGQYFGGRGGVSCPGNSLANAAADGWPMDGTSAADSPWPALAPRTSNTSGPGIPDAAGTMSEATAADPVGPATTPFDASHSVRAG